MELYRPFGAFRLLLAMLVVISHTHVFAGQGEPLRPLSLGNLGVMSFFVLSGYVIAEAVNVFYKARPGAFLLNRALRIFPPFLVALALSVLLHRLSTALGPLRFFDVVEHPETMFEVSNIAGNVLSLIVPVGLGRLGVTIDYTFVRYAWAVAIELLFYYAIAALLFASTRPAVERRISTRTFWLLSTVLVGLAFVVRRDIFGWAPYFVLGVGLYRLSVAPSWRVRVTVILFGLLMNWHAFEYVSRNDAVHGVLVVVLLDALMVVLWILSQQRISGRWVGLDKFFGDLTYPLYLNHYALGIVVLSFVPSENFSSGLFLGYLLLALVFAYAAMQLSEPLTRHLRDRIRGRSL